MSAIHISPSNADELVVRGHKFDAIVTVGEHMFHASDAILYLKEIFQAITSRSQYPTDELLSDIAWKVPIGDASKPVSDSWQEVDFRASYLAFTKYLELEEQTTDWKAEVKKIRAVAEVRQFLFEPEQLRYQLWPYLSTALEFAERFPNAKVCVTQSGYVGLVPGRTRPGDLVALYDGALVPVVTRESDRPGFCYHL